jgi:hypothetical protein
MAKKARKKPARKSLKLRKKPLRDLPAKKKVKGGVDATLSPSQQAALKFQQQPTFAPPYVPVSPNLQNPRPR